MMLQAILENGLVAQADKSSLEAVLSEAAAYTDGTQDGYEVLDQVRAQAQAVLEDGNATQAETDGAAYSGPGRGEPWGRYRQDCVK